MEPTFFSARVVSSAMRMRVAIVLGVLLFCLCACGQDTGMTSDVSVLDAPAQFAKNGRGEEVFPSCSLAADRSVALADDIAPAFLFPPGTRFTQVEALPNNPNTFRVLAHVPQSVFQSMQYIALALRNHHYTLNRAELDPGDAEAVFSGPELRGGIQVSMFSHCDAVTVWFVTLSRTR